MAMIESARAGDPARSREPVICPACERAALLPRHCKSICEACGYVESCEDNFVPNIANPGAQGETIA